ncbi:hypothetical protein [Halomonas nitroreducens]|uniref:Uncharacterized protein n=1 Tax=Halomonas nitroreducens TaxID=447425 RepID=A0A3S0JYN0_9GAMM|nr:hypothetical protein [Halomonas nitroreducens]RTR05271.1 hypothetical protein EKG36_06715 [Halomonas nitroreducens]
MIKTPTLLLMATALALPSLAMGDTLELPADAQVEMEVVDDLVLDAQTPRRDDIVLRPVDSGTGSHRLPDYCVVTGDAQRDGDRIRLTTHSLTCIEAEGGDSEIYSGELTAGAYGSDGHFGIAACDDDQCRLAPGDSFLLTLTSPIRIEQQANPSAQLNAERREANPGQVDDAAGE